VINLSLEGSMRNIADPKWLPSHLTFTKAFHGAGTKARVAVVVQFEVPLPELRFI
jgi:hypothetical protein